jgi:hypothetical protein
MRDVSKEKTNYLDLEQVQAAMQIKKEELELE